MLRTIISPKLCNMKKLLLILTVVTLTFQSCSSDDDDSDGPEISPFAGIWSGTYAGDDSGTWTMEWSDSGIFVKGSSFSNNAQESFATTSATINADGVGTSVSENGTLGTSQTTGNKVTGTWINPNFDISGTITGTRE